MRVGTGFDIHRLIVGRPLSLGGIKVPFEKGLEGHSDGDALTHAIIDALLGAAALGDIGMWFPPDDPKYKDANSLELLKEVHATLLKHEYRLVNLDAVIICEQPKLSPFLPEMCKHLAEALTVLPAEINVKATTAERLGAIGAGEAVAAQAVVLID